MNLERLKQISQDKNLAPMSEWMEVNDELTKVLNSDKKFFAYAQNKAKESKKANVGVVDLFTMVELYISYKDKDAAYTKFSGNDVENEDNESEDSVEQKDESTNTDSKDEATNVDIKDEVVVKPKRKRRTKAEILGEVSKVDPLMGQVVYPELKEENKETNVVVEIPKITYDSNW